MLSRRAIAIVGASGYTGEALIQLLASHPGAEITAVTSRQSAGCPVAPPSSPASTLIFEDLGPQEVGDRAEVIFLALPHGVSAEFAAPLIHAGKVVIDLSADFRLKAPPVYEATYGKAHAADALLNQAVYALPELNRAQFAGCRLFACPGCYPTTILLPLVPLIRERLIELEGIVINSLSGVSGAGKKPDLMYSFCEREGNLKAYGWPRHRHCAEVEQELSLAAGSEVRMTFTPHLVPMTRGMLSTLSVLPKNPHDAEALRDCLQRAYKEEPFVHVCAEPFEPETKHVCGGNHCLMAIHQDPVSGRCQIISSIDNLIKGAGGQAVQVFNLISGWAETTGLHAGWRDT